MSTVVGIPPGVTASGFKPSPPPTIPVTTGLRGWWDANDAASFTYTSGTLVSQWSDRSGTGNHLAVVAAGKEPDRAGTRNGHPVVQFRVTDQLRVTPAAPISASTSKLSVFAVFIHSGANTYEAWPLTMTTGSSADPYDWWGPNLYVARWQFSNMKSAADVIAWEQQMLELDTAGGTLTARQFVNGAQLGTAGGSYGGTWVWDTAGQVVMMGSRGDGITQFTGDIAEMAVYDRVLTTTERQQVETYLRTKWGTP